MTRFKKDTAIRLFKLICQGNALRLLLVFLCILVSTGASVQGFMFLKVLIDEHVAPLLLTGSRDFSGLLTALARMAGLYLAGILATLVQNRTMVSVSNRVLKGVRDSLFSHMQALPLRYFDTHIHGDTMSIFTNDVDVLRQMVGQSFPQMLSTCVTMVTVLFALFVTSLPLTLLVLCFVAVMLFILQKIARRSGSFFIQQQRSMGKLDGYAEEMVAGQKVIKVFCHEAQASEGFDTVNDELCRNAATANSYAGALMPILVQAGNLQYVLVAVVGGALALSGSGLTIGGIASFLQLSKTFTQPIGPLSQQLNAIILALAGAERIFTFLDESPEADGGAVTLTETTGQENNRSWAWQVPRPGGPAESRPLHGDVRFAQVSFAYEPSTPVLRNISLYAKPGQKVAFVGATGAGKTTITNLINRFYDVDEGVIHYDGIPVNEMKKSDLRRSLGIVLQDTNLFTGTVRENIRYGRLDATDQEVEDAARLANAHDFILRLPQGYDTLLTGNGSSLSQGQRQLMSIARCAVADPPVMILDEATSSIDTRTEALVQQGMDRLMEGRTVFVIAHRLSTVQNANAIMVLDHGVIIERGSHDELVALGGTYYQLYTGAFELE